MSCHTGVPKRLHIIRGPDNITVALATEVSMHCTVSGFPVPMVHWFKDSCLMTNSSASFSLHNNGQLLTITSGTCFFLSFISNCNDKPTLISLCKHVPGHSHTAYTVFVAMFSGMSPKRMKAGITVKHSTRKSQSSLIQPFFFQLVIDHIYHQSKTMCSFHLNSSMGKSWKAGF